MKLATQLYFKTFPSYGNQYFLLNSTALLKWWIKLCIAKSFEFLSRESPLQLQAKVILPYFLPCFLTLGKLSHIYLPPGLHL